MRGRGNQYESSTESVWEPSSIMLLDKGKEQLHDNIVLAIHICVLQQTTACGGLRRSGDWLLQRTSVVRGCQTQNTTRNIGVVFFLVHEIHSNSPSVFARNGQNNIVVDTVGIECRQIRTSDTPNKDFDSIILIAKPLALRKLMTQCHTRL